MCWIAFPTTKTLVQLFFLLAIIYLQKAISIRLPSDLPCQGPCCPCYAASFCSNYLQVATHAQTSWKRIRRTLFLYKKM